MHKLSRLKIKLQDNDNGRISYRQGSLFHGVLMENLSPEYADELHESQLHPYSQYLERQDDNLFWIINCTNEKASENILSGLLHKDSVNLKKTGTQLKIIDKVYEEQDCDNLVRGFYQDTESKYINIKVKTPTSFKVNGEYCIFPETRKIYKSLMNKYDKAMSDGDSSVFDVSILDELCDKTRITRYNLRTCGFPLEGVTISSFIGSFTLKVDGPQSLVNFAHMLFKFGEYSGMGIKTSVGMGAICVENKNGSVNYGNE